MDVQRRGQQPIQYVPKVVGPPNYPLILRQKLGQGSCGSVYRATPTNDWTLNFAVKIQSSFQKGKIADKQIQFYLKLANEQGNWAHPFKRSYIPSIFYLGIQDVHRIIVMELMRTSLNTIFLQKKRFSLRTVLMLADQMISCLQFVHDRGILHRDLKPSNFCIGLGDKRNQVFLVDFGLAQFYVRDGKHISEEQKGCFVGNFKYSSRRNILKKQQSRRDELQSLGYILVHFYKQIIPWRDIKAKQPYNQRYLRQYRKQCKSLPDCFNEYFTEVGCLSFEQRPDYLYLKKIFRTTFYQYGFKVGTDLFEE